jgi:hypothetical protein
MGWTSLGALTLNQEWQSFEGAAIGSETFRIRQEFGSKPIGKAWIAQTFAIGNDFYGFHPIYPNKDNSLIVTLTIPEDFKREGLIVRYLVAKMAVRTRVFNLDWRLTLEAFD